MITRLVGTYAGIDDDGSVIVMCGCVGYAVRVSDRDRPLLAVRGQQSVALAIRAVYREESQTLYGFVDADDRRAFDKVVKIDGCGPAVAMRLLSLLTVAQIKEAVFGKDAKALTKVPGVGAKMATKLIEGLVL